MIKIQILCYRQQKNITAPIITKKVRFDISEDVPTNVVAPKVSPNFNIKPIYLLPNKINEHTFSFIYNNKISRRMSVYLPKNKFYAQPFININLLINNTFEKKNMIFCKKMSDERYTLYESDEIINFESVVSRITLELYDINNSPLSVDILQIKHFIFAKDIVNNTFDNQRFYYVGR